MTEILDCELTVNTRIASIYEYITVIRTFQYVHKDTNTPP